MKGRAALKIEWEGGPNATYASDAYQAALTASANAPGKQIRSAGDAAGALQSAAKHVKADYYAPHLTQAPMEPPAATARVRNGKCELWSCVQSPEAARNDVAKLSEPCSTTVSPA